MEIKQYTLHNAIPSRKEPALSDNGGSWGWVALGPQMSRLWFSKAAISGEDKLVNLYSNTQCLSGGYLLNI